MASEGRTAGWRRIEPTTVQKVGYRTVVTKTFVMPSGEVATFDTLCPEGQQFVAVIALTSDNQAIIARQFRIGPELIMDELPGGFVDAGESTETAARRELLEETGYESGRLTYLGPSHKDTYMNAVWHFYLAVDCIQSATAPRQHEAEEHVEITYISIDQMIDNAKHDRMTDPIAVPMAYDELQKRRAVAS